jgi:transcriptional regulator with XRE-family HTH domain
MPAMIAKPVELVVGRRVRELRTQQNWTQDEFARRLRETGFASWSRSTVAALENGGKRLEMADLVALSVVLDTDMASFLASDAEWVSLSSDIEMRTNALVKLIHGCSPREIAKEDFRPTSRGEGFDLYLRTVLHSLLDSLARSELAPRLADPQPELEQYLARQLGTSPSLIALASLVLWGRTASEERDRRAESRSNAKQFVGREIARELKETLIRRRGSWVVRVDRETPDRLIEMPDGVKLLVKGKFSESELAPDVTVTTSEGKNMSLEVKSSSAGRGRKTKKAASTAGSRARGRKE